MLTSMFTEWLGRDIGNQKIKFSKHELFFKSHLNINQIEKIGVRKLQFSKC